MVTSRENWCFLHLVLFSFSDRGGSKWSEATGHVRAAEGCVRRWEEGSWDDFCWALQNGEGASRSQEASLWGCPDRHQSAGRLKWSEYHIFEGISEFFLGPFHWFIYLWGKLKIWTILSFSASMCMHYFTLAFSIWISSNWAALQSKWHTNLHVLSWFSQQYGSKY